MANSLKAIFGLILLTGPLFAGFQQYTPWIMVPLVCIFTVAKISEKSDEGMILLKGIFGRVPEITVGQSFLLLGASLLTQMIVVPLFFAVAFGVSAMISGRFENTYPWYLPLILSGFGVIAALIIARGTADDLADEMMQDEVDGHSPMSLMDRWNDMYDATIMMPIDIFSLAREMVTYPDRALIGALLDQGYELCDNRFQRRVFFTYVRFVDGGDLGFENVEARILDGLDSEHDWVAYDAAWAFGTLSDHNPTVVARLREIAAENPMPEEVASSDAMANFHAKVHAVLAQLDG
ncbi:hypothetical protein N9Z87_00435 [Amylibacter sp.]|nr:hypothetical protein [Amylibacter sp.]